MADVKVTQTFGEAENTFLRSEREDVWPDGSHPDYADVRRWFDRIADPSDVLTKVTIEAATP